MAQILEEKFPFIQENVFLVAHVNIKTGKQKLIMQKENPITGEIEFSDYIECIHTAVADISFDDYEELQDDSFNYFQQEEFQEKMLKIRSSEDVVEINLAPEEKFKALKSWIAGIAEFGRECFKIVADIELAGQLIYPIAGKLLQFMIKIDSDFVFEYLDKIDRECIFEGIRHEPSLVANLIPIFEMLYEDFNEPGIPNRREIMQRIFDFNFSLKLISENARELTFILNEYPEMTTQNLTDTIKRAINKLNKKEIIKMVEPLCLLFIKPKTLGIQSSWSPELRIFIENSGPQLQEFIHTILSLNPPKNWLRKYRVSSKSKEMDCS